MHHPWTLSNDSTENEYSPVFSYPVIDEDMLQAIVKIEVEPVETTMIPFLEVLFGDDIQASLEESGVIGLKGMDGNIRLSSGNRDAKVCLSV